MEREAKAKIVMSVWGAEFIQFLAPLDSEKKVDFILFFQIDQVKVASAARN